MQWLRDEHAAGRLNLPFGQDGAFYPDFAGDIDEAAWNAEPWNPPRHYLGGQGPADPNGSPKPTWAAVTAALNPKTHAGALHDALGRTRNACEALIWAAYGAHSPVHELQLRAAGNTTGNGERARLVRRYDEIKRWLYPTSHAAVSWAGEPPAPDAGSPSMAVLATFNPRSALKAALWPPLA